MLRFGRSSLLGSFILSGLCALPVWAAKPDKPVVFVTQAEKKEISDLLSYPARITSKVNATILSESDGVVSKIMKPLGSVIKRGDEILRVQHTDPVYQYAPVQVISPVRGVVSAVDVTEGSQVKQGQKLAAVTDPNKTLVTIEVAAADLSTIHPGLKAELKVPGRKTPIAVAVSGVSPFVDPATGTAGAELEFISGPAQLPPGAMGRVYFKVRAHAGFQVPEDAVVYRGKKTLLRLVEDNKAKLTPVELGPIRRGLVEIQNGIQEGNTVVVRASQFIADGEEVTVQENGAQ
ncbi:MAG: efflux RND transporter periplasmic adaptor subunit [Bdellovibrionales bacterium]|nr:efflux RND transporter periplasmic adaptor subunit [Bdellovibrionales bacterium]